MGRILKQMAAMIKQTYNKFILAMKVKKGKE
jgi:hypothetical protein